MRGHLLKQTAQAVKRMPNQWRSSSSAVSAKPEVFTLSQEEKDNLYPKIGNRDIVGHGMNGQPMYEDREDYPYPSIRWKANTPDVMALREKEKGDWKNLTMEDRKGLYRASFCQTFSEIKAPTGEWKSITAGTLLVMSLCALWDLWQEEYIFKKSMPSSMDEEYKEYMIQRQIKQGRENMTGLSAEYDFENREWKKK